MKTTSSPNQLASRLGKLVMGASMAMSLSLSAQVVLLDEDFGDTVQNPADNPTTTTVTPWTYTGPGGANSSRLFSAAAGGGFNSVGWISNVDGSAVTATVPLAGLAGSSADLGGGAIDPAATFRLTFVFGAETSNATNSATGVTSVTPSTGSATFVTGGNADDSTLLTAFTDTFTVFGGTVGKSPERSFTIDFNVTGMTTADSLDITLTYDSHLNAFGFYDDAKLEVNPAPLVAPTVTVSAGSSSSTDSITVNGEVTDTGGEDPTVTIYFGETDGLEVPENWDDFIVLIGPQDGLFSEDITLLLPNTTYFYRAFASNSAGDDWSDTSESVTTASASAPTVVVDPLAVAVTSASTAFVGGEVTDDGFEVPNVLLYYGTADGGTDSGSWENFVDLGFPVGPFTTELLDLQGDTTYFFRAYAANSAGEDWSDTAETVTTDPFVGITAGLHSSNFAFQYEMEVDPSTQDLDMLGSVNDFFPNPAQATGVDQTMWIPQSYAGGIASSNQAASPPEALFRTDYGGSIQRESLVGDFTVEVAIQLTAGTIADPVFDLGGFAMYVNPSDPASRALRLNINETETSLGDFGEDIVATGSNTDAFHTFRVVYVDNDRHFWIYRDDVLVYGVMAGAGGGISGKSLDFYDGGLLIGDFAFDISGDWQIDYIRLHNAAVEPAAAVSGLAITNIGFVNPTTLAIDFTGTASTAYVLKSGTDLVSFETIETPVNSTSTTTDASGVGHVEIDVTGRVAPGELYLRVEVP